MKKFKFYLLATVALVVAAVACKKEPEPEPDPVLTISDAKGTAVTKLSFVAEGESATLTLKSNVDWSAKGPDWVAVAPASGNGDASVKLTAAANEAETARNGEVVFTYSEKTLKIAVSQAAKQGGDPGPGPEPTFDGHIKTAEDFATWMALETPVDAVLDADITLPATFVPDTLTTVFDGQNHTITLNMLYEGSEKTSDNPQIENFALFKIIAATGAVKNLNTAGSVKLIPSSTGLGTFYVASIAGKVLGTIENCVNNAEISNTTSCGIRLGGIAGAAYEGAKILNCTNKGKVWSENSSNSQQLGGILGNIEATTTIENCTNDGEVAYLKSTSGPRIAGIVGYVNNVTDLTFKNCVNNGKITGEVVSWSSGYNYIGGITGYYGTPTSTGSTVLYENCVNNGDIEAIGEAASCARLGGIASYGGNSKNPANANVYTFKNCVNKGKLFTNGTTAKKVPIGGIVGMGEVSAKFVLEDCTQDGVIESSANIVGGLIGHTGGTESVITNCIVTENTVLKTIEGGNAGLFAGLNAAYTSAMTGKVGPAKIIKGEAETVAAFANYKSLLFGAALGEGGSVEGVEWGGEPPAAATIYEFAKEYVKIIDIWEQNMGPIKIHSSLEPVENAHYVPETTTITVGAKTYNTADMLETALRSYLLVRGFNGLDTESKGAGSIAALEGGAVAMSATTVPDTHAYEWGSEPYSETTGNGGYLVMVTEAGNVHNKVKVDILDNWAMRSLNFQHGKTITNICGYSSNQLAGYSGSFCPKRALLTYAFFFKHMLDNNIDKGTDIADDVIFRSELLGDEYALKGIGTANDPFKVTTGEDMTKIGGLLELGTYKYVRLENDIDMKDVTEWVPIHEENDNSGIIFEGNNKTISNFKVVKTVAEECTHKYMSLFGILHGSVKNLTVKDPVLDYNLSTPIGIIAGWAGNSNASCTAEIENVHVINGSVTSRVIGNNLGGFVGSTHATSFKNCSYDGAVIREVSADSDNSYRYTGGLIGRAPTEAEYMVSIDDCYTTGSIDCKAGRAVAGIIGGVNAKARIKINNTWSSMNIESLHDVVAGIAGYWGGGELHNCHYSGNINVKKGSNSYTGGIVAHSNYEIELYNCWSEGTISTVGAIVGGLVGQSNAVADGPKTGLIIKESWSTMTINVTGSTVGGLAGRCSVNQPCTIENSWYAGAISCTGNNNAYVGGIIGDLPKNSSITNCWVDAPIKATFGMGGIAGRLWGLQGAAIDQTANINISATGNIAFGSIKCIKDEGDTPENHYSSGVISGFNSTANTLKNNWRSADYSFTAYTNKDDDVLFDQEDSDPEHPLADAKDHTAAAYKYFRPYHGKAAAAGATISSLAKTIGWDETIWDLSGDKPALKNTKKQ